MLLTDSANIRDVNPVSGTYETGSVGVEQQRLQRLITRLQARAQPRLPTDLIALIIDGAQVGILNRSGLLIAEKVDGFRLSEETLILGDSTLDFEASSSICWPMLPGGCEIAGLITGWRDEALSVGNPPLAQIERAACRPLGIATEAVHLNAYADCRHPTLRSEARGTQAKSIQVSGITWSEAQVAWRMLQQALQREAWEEAGLQLEMFK